MDITRRSFTATLRGTENRNEEEAEEKVLGISGHAAVFNQRTLIGSRRYGFVEELAPGAFAKVLEDDTRFLLNHEGITMARTANGTLRLAEDSEGLATDGELNPNMQVARDLHAAIEREDIDQMSFAFTIAAEEIRELPDDDPDYPGMVIRTITEVDRLYDVSAVSFPAYEGASIGARNAQAREGEIEEVLARAGTPTKTEETPAPAEASEETPEEGLLSREQAAAKLLLRRRAALRSSRGTNTTNKEVHNGRQ